MLPSTSPTEALLACPSLSFFGTCLPSLWSPRFPLHAPALTPLTFAKVRLSLTFTLSPLTIWYSGQTALFLSPLAKAAPAYLPTALSMALRPLFPFQQSQYAQVFLLKPEPFCKLFGGLGSTNKSSTSLLLSDSRSILSSIFPFTLNCNKNCLLPPPVLSGLNGSPDTRFFRGTTRLKLVRRGVLHVPSAIPCGLSLIHFSQTGGILSHRNSSTHRFPRFPRAPLSRSLCSLSSTLQRTQPTVKLLSLQDRQNRESFLQLLRTLFPGHLLSHSALSSYGLFAPLAL